MVPEGYHLFRYKDEDTKDIPHMMDLEDYGVTKKWVIITENSKEVENNTMTRLNVYVKQYTPRRTGAVGGSSTGGGSSGRS
jgi:archaellum biogenesis ATPase FlaH